MSCGLTKKKHPHQPIILKKGHEPYFLENKIVITLLEEFGVDSLMDILKDNNQNFNTDDYEQFFQLIGVSCDYFTKSKCFSKKSRDEIQDIVNKIKKTD